MKRLLFLDVLIVVALALVIGVSVVAAAPVAVAPAQQEPVALTPELLAAVLGVVLSLAASYIPKFRTWWAALLADYKQLIMALANIAIGVAIYLLACSPDAGFTFVSCPAGGVWGLAQIILLALIANQTTDRVSPDTADVKAVKSFPLKGRV